MLLQSFVQKVVTVAAGSLMAAGASALDAQQVQTLARPAVRITQKIDNSVTTPLAGTHPGVVDHAVIGARLSASKPLSHMTMVLSPSDDQVYALRTLMDQQQDKTSPNFHKWLTPDSYGQLFGVSSADMAKITAWLGDQGFTVNSIAKNSRMVTFSGTVGQVETAFHTKMNNLTVNGEAHISNTTDISVPQAFAGVVRGVTSLDDFFPKSNVVNPHKATVTTSIPANNYITPDANPLYSSTVSGTHYVTPGDAATIFNSTPLLTSGIDGTGQTIAVIGRTDISLADVQQFRSMFGLKKNDPTFTVVGEDPGVTSDDIEAYLDVEWAGGMAPGATVNFIVAGSDYITTSGISASALYAVDNNIGDIITLSYGSCEFNSGASSSSAFWNTVWEQAASQGQSAFVSSGDGGATCTQNVTYGTSYGVNPLGSSNYNVAVGGSMFVDYGQNQYWTTGTAPPPVIPPPGYNFATATSYIPEAPWNEGFFSTTYLNTLATGTLTGGGAVGGGGGISVFNSRPTWQTGSGVPAADPTNCSQTNSSGTCAAAGVSGAVSGVHRLVPDIAGIAASGHDATIICYEGSCYNNTAGYGIGAVGGTSVAAPVSASIQALINQKNGGRQGNPNFHYYPLANVDYVSGVCKSLNGTVSNPTVVLPAATCNFHDIVTGSNVEKISSTDTVGYGFFGATGYDEASGLGSMNINNIATNWSTVSLTSTTTTFTLTPTTTTHGTSQTFAASVSSSAGTPTGDISLIAVTTNPGTTQRYTLTSGAYSGTITGLPGGTYNVYVHYEGDGTYGPSDSATQTVTIAKEASAVTNTVYYFVPGSYTTNPSTVPYGSILDFITTTAGTSANGNPTGTMSFAITNTGTGTVLPSLTSTLDASGVAPLIAGGTYTALLLAANYPSLPVGVYSIAASYSGDNSFNASSTTTSVTIARQVPTATLTISSAYIASGASDTLTYAVARQGGTTIATLAAYPSGTVTFTDTTSGTTLGTATLNSVGVATLTTTGITTTGANTITATYSGDSNYSPLTTATTGTVTVGAYTTTATTLAGVSTGTYYVGSTVSLTATVTPAASAAVRFYDGSTYLGSATSSASTGIATFSTTALTAGSHTLNAFFVGTTTYAASSGSTTLTVSQNITTTYIETNTIATVGQVVAINARITRAPSSPAVPTIPLTGTVTFYDGTTAIGTATPVFQPGGTGSYLATLSISTLARGVHTLTATYTSDGNYATSTSGRITLTELPDNVWIANSGGTVSAVTASGTAMANGTGGGTGIAIDNSGDIWSLNKSASSVAEFSSTGTVTNSGYTGAGITTPTALAIDGSGMVWITNSNSTVSVLTNTGTAVSGSSGYPTTTSTPSSLSIDASGNLWITNAGDNSVTEVIGAAAPVTTPTTMAVKNNNLAAKP